MNRDKNEASAARWHRLTNSFREHTLAFGEFLEDCDDHVPWIREGLRSGGVERAVALKVFPYLDAGERMRLFGDLVFLASASHGAIGTVRHLLLGLPRDFVLSTIELEAEPYLQTGNYDEYLRFLELYELLDHDLTLKLARRAATHSDPDIREAGEDYLGRLSPASVPR